MRRSVRTFTAAVAILFAAGACHRAAQEAPSIALASPTTEKASVPGTTVPPATTVPAGVVAAEPPPPPGNAPHISSGLAGGERGDVGGSNIAAGGAMGRTRAGPAKDEPYFAGASVSQSRTRPAPTPSTRPSTRPSDPSPSPSPDAKAPREERKREHDKRRLELESNRELASEADAERDALHDDGERVAAASNPLVDANVDPLSTFAIDVDTGSYTLSRRFLESGAMPQAHAVRVEEWVNAFHYSYPDTSSEHPFSIHVEGAPLAQPGSYVMRVGIQGMRIEKAERAPVHLTFLVDVSGSMRPHDRLPLAKQSLKVLLAELGPKDSVGIVTYAGDTRVVLAGTAVTQANRARISAAIDGLSNGGGTAMGSGMELAYREAGKALGDKGISRVIILSDGDTNIGPRSFPELLKKVNGYVSEGVTLSTVGFGVGNLREHLMEQLADAGNGNYSYVGSLKDAKRIFVDDLTGTLQVIAKDTKIQVEMNQDVVASYRLIGYENRNVADEDFRNDKVDAGEIGAGHTVTALYEVHLKEADVTADIATVRVRYQQPRGGKATEVSTRFPAAAMHDTLDAMSADGRFATGVAFTAEVFRHSEHMSRLGIGLSDAHRLLVSGAVGPFAAERTELAHLIGPLIAGAPVATR